MRCIICWRLMNAKPSSPTGMNRPSRLIMRHTLFKGESAPFIMELPAYHLPTFRGVFIRTWDRLTTREKITNIRDSENNVIWKELNFPSDSPTVFEVIGTTPITDPFGKTMGFNSSVMRSENQQIGL